MSPVSILLLIVFAMSILITYLTVRRTQVNIVIAAVVGSIIDVIVFGLYSLTAGNSPTQALLVGLVLGLVFNLITVAAAAFFRQNAPAR